MISKKNNQTLEQVNMTDNFDIYYSQIGQQTILTKEKEQELFQKSLLMKK